MDKGEEKGRGLLWGPGHHQVMLQGIHVGLGPYSRLLSCGLIFLSLMGTR